MIKCNRKWIYINDKHKPNGTLMLYVVNENEQFVWGIVVDDPKEEVVKVARTRILSTLEEMD